MKIVVLDGYTLNPGDLDWKGIERFGDVTVYDRTQYNTKDILKNIGDAEVIFTNKTPLNSDVINKAPNIKYIGVLATGYNVVDVESAKNSNIIVTNIPDYSSKAVSQFTMGLLLELCHHIGHHNKAVQNGDWIKSKDFSFWNYPLIELSGKTIGIIGFGKIGRATAKLAQAFGLHIKVYNRTTYKALESESLTFVSLDELLKTSDIISLHCPLSKDTEGIINASTLSQMKDGAMLINTSRGPLIIEDDLKTALNNGKLSGAAVDVISEEPMNESNPLLNAKNCIITPHIAWATKEARTRLMQTAANNLGAFLDGKPINVVNK
ncbi:D-2-hydroxyacid dehydrogenase [Algibacter sp. 2305UL17-15]|uniref:D-2-hydroxyacid dehydrogenase n=1 Tax=Algibacter sp. 2305UL17-15 TaxID=3231268 RepID=UPI0034599996